MRAVFVCILLSVLGLSCSKEELDGFDNSISYAQDFKVDANGDTVYSLIMPNAFTPDGDGLNDVYRVWGTGIDSANYLLRVFTREGNMIGYYEDPWSGFPGYTMGYSLLNANAVYTVKLDVGDQSGELHHYTYDILQFR